MRQAPARRSRAATVTWVTARSARAASSSAPDESHGATSTSRCCARRSPRPGGASSRTRATGCSWRSARRRRRSACAVLTQQLFERRYRSREQGLHVRIGLGTGESTVKDGDYFGMPAIEAARLCDKAPADGILVSLMTKMLAGGSRAPGSSRSGELELKGIPEPMEAFRCCGSRWIRSESGVQVGRWPLPEALRSVPRLAYVGRESERALVEDRARRGAVGARQVVLLVGRAGDREDAAGVLCGAAARTRTGSRCAGARAGGSRGAVRAMDRRSARSWSSTHRKRCSPDYVARARRRDRPAGAQPAAADRGRARAAVLRSGDGAVPPVPGGRRVAARRGGARCRCCVVLDDFHWADGQSVALLKHVARGRAGRAAGAGHLPRLGSGQGSPADGGARRSASHRGRRSGSRLRGLDGRGGRADDGRGRWPRARCRRTGARG